MNAPLKIASLGLLLAGSVVTTQAMAAACVNGVSIVAGLICDQGDKRFSFVSNSLPAGTGSFLIDIFPGIERHTFTYTRTGGPTGGTLTYTIEIIDDPLTPIDELAANRFSDVDLSAAVTTPSVTVTKDFSAVAFAGPSIGLLTSIDGSEPADIPVGGDIKKLWITDTVVVGGTAPGYNSITNTYLQTAPGRTPEPGTLALLGLGLAGLATIRRRKA